jgi:phosphomannomutase / phosphoglucomutase
MIDHIFRQYDIRGKIGSDLAIEEVYQLTQAIATYFKQLNPSIKRIAVGADGRIQSPAIKKEMCRALQDAGLDVLFIGICPSPVLYFALFMLPVDGGLMITASHNGKEYNGIKMCLGKESVWGEQIQQIKELVKKDVVLTAHEKGVYEEYNLIEDYTDWLVQHFTQLVDMPLRAVVDCGNGAAGTVWPLLIKKMKWSSVTLLCQEVDGTFPNHEADPTVEKNMQDVKSALNTSNYDVGLGLDGDCDRMTPMSLKGELVSGDKLLALFAQDIIAQKPGAKVVFDIKCSSGLPELLKKWGGAPCMSASGHSIIKDQMRKQKAVLAGELSCHFFFNDRYFGYDDGNYAALRLFELLLKNDKTLDELLTVFPHRYATNEMRIVCPQEQMDTIVSRVKDHFIKEAKAEVLTIDGIRVNKADGWGLVRSSNTQPVICLRFEANSLAGLSQLKDEFLTVLIPYFDKDLLIKEFNTI